MVFSYHEALFIALLFVYCVLTVGASQSQDQKSELNDLKKQVADLQQRLADQEYNLVSVSVSQYEVHQQTTEHTHMQNALMEQLNRTCQRMLKKISVLGKDCSDLYKGGIKESGVYTIHPDGLAVNVYCDMVTDGGGWTVFQRRQDGSVDFYRDWSGYRAGFGDMSGEFWLGNANIYRLTRQASYKLRIDLEDFNNTKVYAVYDSFSVGSGEMNYTLTIGSYSGTAGDSLTSWHNGQPFTTKDRDNDNWSDGSCAVSYIGAWWYNTCHASNLNGQYGNDKLGQGVGWWHFRGNKYALKRTSMMIRPVGFKSSK